MEIRDWWVNSLDRLPDVNDEVIGLWLWSGLVEISVVRRSSIDEWQSFEYMNWIQAEMPAYWSPLELPAGLK